MKKKLKIGTLLLMALTLTTFITSCGKKKTLYLYNWTYYIPDEVLASFEKEFNIHVDLETYDSNDTMYAKLVSGNAQYDVAVPSGDFVSIMRRKGMIQPLNLKKIPNAANIDPKIWDLADFDPAHEYSVPYFVGTTGIHVNTKYVTDYEESWNIFTKTDRVLQNRMTMMNDMRDVLGGALKYLGYSGNSVNPAEIEQAKKLIVTQWKPHLLKFDAESFGKDFARKTTYVAEGFAEVVLKEMESPDDLEDHKFFIPREGSMIDYDNLVILKTSKNPEAAHVFINYLLRPEIHAQIADGFYYPTIMPAAKELRKATPPYEISDLFDRNCELKKDLGEANSLYAKAWDEILSGY